MDSLSWIQRTRCNIVICKERSLPTYVICSWERCFYKGKNMKFVIYFFCSWKCTIWCIIQQLCCLLLLQISKFDLNTHIRSITNAYGCFLLFLHNLPHCPSSDELWTRHWVISGTSKNNERNSRENCECCIWELREIGGPVSLQITVIRYLSVCEMPSM